MFKLHLEPIEFDRDQIEWEGAKIDGGQVFIYFFHSVLATADVMKSAFFITAVFSEECIKPFVKGLPCTLIFRHGQYLEDFASFRAMRDHCWEVFAQDSDLRDGELDIFSLDRHGGWVWSTQNALKKKSPSNTV
jgi:hypothetical protein